MRRTTRTIGNSRGLPDEEVSIPTVNEDPSTLFVSCKGREYGSWVDTGGRSNSFNAGELIENPAFIVESILRDMLGYADAKIDMTAFDVCSVYINGYKLAFSWNTKEPAFSRLAEIAKEVGAIFGADSSGKFKMRRVFQDVHDFRFVANDLLGKNSLRVYRSSSDLIANELIFRYRYNYATNQFDEEIEVSVDATNNSSGLDFASRIAGFRDGYVSYITMMSDSRTQYNVTRRMIVEARHIREDGTAVYAAQRIMDWHALHRYVVELDCPLKILDSNSTQTTADIEAGDFALINHDLLPAETSGIVGTGGLSDSALFVVTKVIFDPRTLVYHFVLRETPYSDLPTDAEQGQESSGYGAVYGTDYGGGL